MAANAQVGFRMDYPMTLASRLLALAPHVYPAIAVAPAWAALIAEAKSQQKEAKE